MRVQGYYFLATKTKRHEVAQGKKKHSTCGASLFYKKGEYFKCCALLY